MKSDNPISVEIIATPHLYALLKDESGEFPDAEECDAIAWKLNKLFKEKFEETLSEVARDYARYKLTEAILSEYVEDECSDY